MSDYERVTLRQGEPKIVSKRVYHRLRELEDKIENGTLIELPRIIHPNKLEWFVQYQYPNGIIHYCVCFSESEAEKKLEELRSKK